MALEKKWAPNKTAILRCEGACPNDPKNFARRFLVTEGLYTTRHTPSVATKHIFVSFRSYPTRIELLYACEECGKERVWGALNGMGVGVGEVVPA